MSHHFVAGESSLWAQVNGPNTEPVYLGCHEIGDITETQGDITLIYCPDESGVNRFKVVSSVQGAASPVKTDLTTDIMDEIDSIERTFGAFTLFVHKTKRGRRDQFANWDRSFPLLNARVSESVLSALSARQADDNKRSEQKFSLSAEALLRPVRPTLARQSISEVNAINDITFCNTKTERTSDSPALDSCQTGYAACNFAVSASANVLKTTDGATWAATAADPFAVSETISAIECFEISRDTYRVVVARGTTDASNPAEIAYSDDGGATWQTVNIDSVNAKFVPARNSMFARDKNDIWVGLDSGLIVHSGDGGLTWQVQEAGIIHTGLWNAIHFANGDVGVAAGAANVIAFTLDGGASWAAVSGPSAQSAVAVQTVWCLDKYRWWIGYANGKLYYTLDGGTTWSQRSFTGTGVGAVRDIAFLNDLQGFMVTNNASPVGKLHMTIDGGFTWEALTTPTNAGLNKVWICDQWKVFVCGLPQSSLGFIGKAIA